MKRFLRYLLGVAAVVALGLACWLPLRAEESAPPAAAPVPVTAAPAEKSATADEEAVAPKPDEALSADNSISFPVDI
jgi:hypothetical protein